MLAQTTKPANVITLQGSIKIVVEFFEYSINSILFQRGLYPPEDFKMVKKYGLNMLVSTDERLQAYLQQILTQLESWLAARKVSKLVMAMKTKETREVVERWQFDIKLMNDKEGNKEKENKGSAPAGKKDEKEIHSEIQAIIRQITASVTFLPVLEEPCTFNILVYTDKDAEVPTTWVDSDPHYIKNSEQVRLRSFSTNVHKVDALVSYRLEDN
ncbi:mitotic spindle checkpoint component mad2 [Paraphysoderma sedebokerense]|nr:mitotic spindle checkpoint component mad2 [Paraphysoderma sedebokerense]